ncbi:hypothetical protein MRB53_001298 [Persea americana]|uniref:Uncharacterized protein n=1 Tax=Persea americana TaxID=3435 RepID=A0ACC2MS65_PERAE|nr:hypothetical protein MRB53_001298 [Persea americana]
MLPSSISAMGWLRRPTEDDGDSTPPAANGLPSSSIIFNHNPPAVAHLEIKIVSLIFHHQVAHFQFYGLQQNPNRILLLDQINLIHRDVFSSPESRTSAQNSIGMSSPATTISPIKPSMGQV